MRTVTRLPEQLLAVLADSPLDFMDLDSRLNEVIAEEMAVEVKKDLKMSEHVIIAEPKGDLYSRLRLLVTEESMYDLQSEFRAYAESHPAMPAIVEDILHQFKAGEINALMDKLESKNFDVAFDRSNNKLTIGLCRSKLFSSFNEFTPLTDRRNKSSIDFVNGVNPMFDKRPTHQTPELQAKTYYLVIGLA